MNNELQEFARKTLIKGLLKLPEGSQLLFKQVYSPKDLNKHIIDVVNDMPEDILDWAMQQVSRIIQK